MSLHLQQNHAPDHGDTLSLVTPFSQAFVEDENKLKVLPYPLLFSLLSSSGPYKKLFLHFVCTAVLGHFSMPFVGP